MLARTLAKAACRRVARRRVAAAASSPARRALHAAARPRGAAAAARAAAARRRQQPSRALNLHEYRSMDVMARFDVPVSRGYAASTPAEALEAAERLQKEGVRDFVVKAQVLAGGRGKGYFTNGFQSGVHLVSSPKEARDVAKQMLGHSLITKQTGEEGKPCNEVLVAERVYSRREMYFAILMDRAFDGPVMVASPKGGMDIEAVAAETPEFIFKEPIDLAKGVQPEQLDRLAEAIGFSDPEPKAEAVRLMENLYKMFLASDNTQVEINPLVETPEGRVLCLDAKLNFDSNAQYRQKEIFSYQDKSQEDPMEVHAEEVGLNYIHLDGNIGCLVNGAGLAMATMDVIKLHGGSPANFLDLGGGASEKQVAEAFKLLNNDPQVRSVLVNIFGGIMRCDVIALGLIRAATEIGLKKPMVVRLAGTNVDAAKELIEESGMRMLTTDDLGDAAKKVVRVTEIVEMADSAKLNVSFELPL